MQGQHQTPQAMRCASCSRIGPPSRGKPSRQAVFAKNRHLEKAQRKRWQRDFSRTLGFLVQVTAIRRMSSNSKTSSTDSFGCQTIVESSSPSVVWISILPSWEPFSGSLFREVSWLLFHGSTLRMSCRRSFLRREAERICVSGLCS
jgi:hypothetical protein